MVGGTWHEDNKRFSGKTVAEIVGLETRDAADVSSLVSRPASSPGSLVCEILQRDCCRTGAFFFGMSEENLAKIYSRPWIVPGSDASLRAPWGPLGADHPHPRAYATMPEFYRRVRALGFSREEAVARMTSVPARRFGIRGRGVLERGAFADVVVWREGDFRAQATYDAPHRFSSGVVCAMVNGCVAWRDGALTGERAGRFLESAGL
jgi:N-acyl-D-amino-acid deacylase